MSSMADLSSAAVISAIVFPVAVAVCLSTLAVLAPRPDVRARAAHLLVRLFGRRDRN